MTGSNLIVMKELEGKIRELGEVESAEREALKEEISLRIDHKVSHLAQEVSSTWNYSLNKVFNPD